MKSLHLIALIGCFFTLSSALAQIECSGVYLTANDFVAGKLLPATDGRPRPGTAEENVLNSKYIFVNQLGRHYKMNTRDVYALRSCEGKIVRIYNEGYYTLLNPGENILIYLVICNPVSKGNVLTRKYYFSKDAGSGIEQLTLDNLKAVFRDNHAFDKAVEAQFSADRDLYAYDNLYKCYRLNSVYNASR